MLFSRNAYAEWTGAFPLPPPPFLSRARRKEPAAWRNDVMVYFGECAIFKTSRKDAGDIAGVPATFTFSSFGVVVAS